MHYEKSQPLPHCKVEIWTEWPEHNSVLGEKTHVQPTLLSFTMVP